MRFRPILIAAALAAASPAAAQTDHDSAVWVNVTAMGSIDEKLVYFAEVQPRVTDDVSRLSQLLLRGAVGYRITPEITLYQGYAHIEEPSGAGIPGRNEERSFQQLSWSLHKAGRADLSSRTRFEQRWRSDGGGMALRLREMLRYEHALSDRERSVGALVWAEGFWGLKSGGWAVREFDQLRSFVGAVIPLPGKSTLEAGYMNQLRDAPGARSNMAHIASLTAFIRY